MQFSILWCWLVNCTIEIGRMMHSPPVAVSFFFPRRKWKLQLPPPRHVAVCKTRLDAYRSFLLRRLAAVFCRLVVTEAARCFVSRAPGTSHSVAEQLIKSSEINHRSSGSIACVLPSSTRALTVSQARRHQSGWKRDSLVVILALRSSRWDRLSHHTARTSDIVISSRALRQRSTVEIAFPSVCNELIWAVPKRPIFCRNLFISASWPQTSVCCSKKYRKNMRIRFVSFFKKR